MGGWLACQSNALILGKEFFIEALGSNQREWKKSFLCKNTRFEDSKDQRFQDLGQ